MENLSRRFAGACVLRIAVSLAAVGILSIPRAAHAFVGPTVTILTSPADPTNHTSASFTFSSTGSPILTECELDGGGFAACDTTTSQAYAGPLSDGVHTFTVRVTDAGSNTGTDARTWTVRSGVCFVDDSASGANDGSSWTDAYTDLQQGIDFCPEVWVAAGIYKPDHSSPGDQTLNFSINDGRKIYGGFAGTETSRDDRNPNTHVTVLSGDIDNNDTVDGNGVSQFSGYIHGNNSYHIVYMDGTATPITAATVLDGFTITGGNASDSSFPDDRGGGLFCDGQGVGGGCSPTLSNLRFWGNHATTYGGGLLDIGDLGGNSNPTLNNVSFEGNATEGSGGAIANLGAGGESAPSITGAQISDSQANVYGGGMYTTGDLGDPSPYLTVFTFSYNNAGSGGGGMYSSGSAPTLYSGTFNGNTSAAGAGMFGDQSHASLQFVDFTGNGADWTSAGGGMYNLVSNPSLSTVTFSGNEADQGGGMYNFGSDPTVSSATFDGNVAHANGGGMANYASSPNLNGVTFENGTAQIGGGLYTANGSNATLNGVTFFYNQASSLGGGMANDGSDPTLTDVTFDQNFANGLTANGGGLYTSGVSASTGPTMSGATFTGNWASTSGGGIAGLASSLTATNATFTGNFAEWGGAIYGEYQSNLTLTNLTLSGNWAKSNGGGLYLLVSSAHVDDSIFWNNAAEIYAAGSSPVIQDSIVFGGCPNGGVCTNVFSSTPLLGALANNGGPTQTMALQLGSAAIDRGNDGTCAAIDQRGVTRPQGAHCDIGAFEYVHTFADVPVTGKEWMEPWIDAFYNAGITTGCGTGPLVYCPESNVTRAEMAVFLLRALHGSGYTPPNVTGIFSDMPVSGKEWMEPWVDEFYNEGLTTGCGTSPLVFCPENNVTRAEMAVFVLRALHGSAHIPPNVTGIFSDMPVAGKEWMEPWADEFYNAGITTGCGTSPLRYCPENDVTRAEMAVFIDRAFSLYP